MISMVQVAGSGTPGTLLPIVTGVRSAPTLPVAPAPSRISVAKKTSP
jgi:hypothetical protein